MKEYIILVVVLVLIFTPNTLFKNYLKKSGNELISIVNDLKNDIEENRIKEGKSDKLKKAFLEREKIWIMIVDHDMLDEIEYQIEDCVALYDNDYKKEFIAAANRLVDAVEDLYKREEISLSNII